MFLVVLVTLGLILAPMNLLASILVVGISVVGAYLQKDADVKKKTIYIALLWAALIIFYAVMYLVYVLFNSTGNFFNVFGVATYGFNSFWAGYMTIITWIYTIAIVVFTVFAVLSWFGKCKFKFMDKLVCRIIGEKEEKKEENTADTENTEDKKE